jgi:hypothetical protein
MSRDNTVNRRNVLRATSAAIAAGTGLAAVGTASASDHCYYEYDCVEAICPVPDESGYSYMRRECCEDSSGDTTCGDWEVVGCC